MVIKLLEKLISHIFNLTDIGFDLKYMIKSDAKKSHQEYNFIVIG